MFQVKTLKIKLAKLALMSIPYQKVKKVHDFLHFHKQKIAFCESLTGGLVSFWFTSLPRASEIFLGSVVSYSQVIKEDFLKIDPALIQQKGVISKEIVLEMASSVQKSFSADWVLALSGSAGSNDENREISGELKDSLGQKVGQVCYALLGPNLQELKEKSFLSKNRQEIQHQSADFALDLMLFSMK